ncbi:MAG: hypothetical protein M3O71_20575 [Bacteroidota bacterium]|nr:hypothetical protein [Bacteroidota bacterium]
MVTVAAGMSYLVRRQVADKQLTTLFSAGRDNNFGSDKDVATELVGYLNAVGRRTPNLWVVAVFVPGWERGARVAPSFGLPGYSL